MLKGALLCRGRSRSPGRRRLTRSPPRKRPPIPRAAHALFTDALRRAVATWPLPFNISLVRPRSHASQCADEGCERARGGIWISCAAKYVCVLLSHLKPVETNVKLSACAPWDCSSQRMACAAPTQKLNCHTRSRTP